MSSGGFILDGIGTIKHNRSYMGGNSLFKNVNKARITSILNYQNEKAELSEAEQNSIRSRIHMKYSSEKWRFRFVAFITTGIAVTLFAFGLYNIF